MKCKKCGLELGQKNLCPVCDSETVAETRPLENTMADISKEELSKIDEFVTAHPTDWNDEFDDFYDKNVFAAGYKETFLQCRHRAEIFDAVREMLKDQKKLSGELMIRIMEEIPQKYPEIQECEARSLAKQLFNPNRTLKLTFRELMYNFVFERHLGHLEREIENRIILEKRYKNDDIVNAGDDLFELPWLTFFYQISQDFNRTNWRRLTSPCRGKIVFIKSQVDNLDDVICEIEPVD